MMKEKFYYVGAAAHPGRYAYFGLVLALQATVRDGSGCDTLGAEDIENGEH